MRRAPKRHVFVKLTCGFRRRPASALRVGPRALLRAAQASAVAVFAAHPARSCHRAMCASSDRLRVAFRSKRPADRSLTSPLYPVSGDLLVGMAKRRTASDWAGLVVRWK